MPSTRLTSQIFSSRGRQAMDARASPSKLSQLLATFGAQRIRGSVTKMARETRPSKRVSYAESSASDGSPDRSSADDVYAEPHSTSSSDELETTGNSHFIQDADERSEDELQSDDVIEVRPRRERRQLPQRSTRASGSYALPVKKGKKTKKIGLRQKPVRLVSDLVEKPHKRATGSHKIPTETERAKIRIEIAENTKPKRQAFFLANKEYFLPLLPDNSYIDKLQRVHDMQDGEEPEDVPYQSIDVQPSNVVATLKPYQLQGLSFLVWMYRNGMSAILGDEMGLGKTLQTLALFQHLKENERTREENRPFLVVCPLSVLSSWMSEVKKWVPNLNAVRFHGPKSERDKLKDMCRSNSKFSKQIDIVVTTYEMFQSEQGWFKRAFVWRYCVLDEGHKIKNQNSQISSVLQGLQAEYRLLLTGTPLQNNLVEMWSLLRWLYPEVFTVDTEENFKRAFDISKGHVSTAFMDDARRLLELVMLRRMKNSPEVNLGLPPKEEVLLYVPLTPMQRFWYTRFLTKADNMLLDDLFQNAKDKEALRLKDEAEDDEKLVALEKAVQDAGEASSGPSDVWAESKNIIERAVQEEMVEQNSGQWKKLMNLVMQLRKVCSHPYILPNAGPDPYYLGDHIKTASGKFIVLDKLVDELVIKQRKKILIFSQFTSTLDLCEDLLMLKDANSMTNAPFRYLRFDGSTGRARRNLGIRMFNDITSEFMVMLVSTRAGGLGINLTSATEVVFMDEDWNPQITLQAEARAHRIGQTNKVTIYKLCSQGTVEEQMMGRIRKKLYLSTKITESMRNIHSAADTGKKRKRGKSDGVTSVEQDAPQLDTGSLKSLIRRGAQTLARPEVNVTEMLGWDWDTVLEQCKDRPVDGAAAEDAEDQELEQRWLGTMEKVETAIFEGKRHQKEIEKAVKEQEDFARADRRVGKNTTVMVNGFAINKESMNCGDWEAVPTFAGKDPRLADPVRAKKAQIQNQEFCQHCWDGGDLACCSGCPRAYHIKCMDPEFRAKAKSKLQFHCPQHMCVDCKSRTSDAGGMLYRCRWCENGYCEDCLDWDRVRLIGRTLPEYEVLGFGPVDQAWYIECPACMKHWEENPEDLQWIKGEQERMEGEYKAFLDETQVQEVSNQTSAFSTPGTVSEIATPMQTVAPPSGGQMEEGVDFVKKMKVFA